ncbi:flagellar basal body L-ring protein FlgH [Bremerella cremea]|uniref:Flagellar basal body L-ring protein FlgH n=1 Tax=Bremerella cremea TaxID=1031537 RepID=A0A368KSN4_9BACT|nr:flagellar basal body L-ring protein FlgH [Bremerella cremea]RCS47734.1 flagellar basal body L-ring protein FlgH [Bremerella cremea]
MKTFLTLLTSIALTLIAAMAFGQQSGPVSSLSQRNMPQLPGSDGVPYNATTKNMNWFYRELPPPRKVQVHDLIHIRVDERAQTFSDGEFNTRKSGQYTAILKDWLKLDGLDGVTPAPQPNGDPAIAGTLTNRLQSQAEMETNESLKFTIASEVQEILPNGTLKLEASKTIQVNDEVWVYHLRGICRTEDINPNNTVLSEQLAELSITKEEKGAIRNAYSRGWLLQLWDSVHWF